MIGERRSRRVRNRSALRNWRRDRFNPIRVRALGDQNRSRSRRRLFNQMAELRMLRLEIDAETVRANLLGADRTDRADRHPRESALDAVADSFGLRELDDVGDLVRAGEDRDVRRARRNRVQRRTQRRAIRRQRPSIDRNDRDARAARLEPRGQFVIGDAIFLHRDAFALEIDLRRERTQHFAPGIRLRHDDRRLEAQDRASRESASARAPRLRSPPAPPRSAAR